MFCVRLDERTQPSQAAASAAAAARAAASPPMRSGETGEEAVAGAKVLRAIGR